ncbi:MAG: saccharopine dehydrogenase NADP-binding domain-containing protein [Myxococcales bacterium]|nr:saccharopine dehydrogenase NADP-binding domain-containing protein [Myxococcales bacterium]
MTSDAREFDLVLFGATGFTGGLVAKHLAAHAGPSVRLALAGRRADALNALRDRLLAAHPERAQIGVVIADVSDPDSLARMAASTRAVLSTVGPFLDYGEPVVSACVAQGTDYLDSTGEHPFVRRMIERYHQDAKQRGVRLIFSCAFEAVPTDLGVYYTVQRLPEGKPIDIVGYLAFRGVFSGGTERSAIKDMAAQRPEAAEYAYEQAGRRGALLPGRVHRAPAVGAWVSPFDAIDPHIVLRSAAALERYGPNFTYTNLLIHPNLFALLGLAMVFGTAALLARVAPVRALMLRVVKPSGRGPTEAQMASGWFRLRLDAQCEDQRVTTEVSGGDPGYGATSMMLGQCALCLLEDNTTPPMCSGVVTPAQVFGDRLIARLQAHGMRFRVSDGATGPRKED